MVQAGGGGVVLRSQVDAHADHHPTLTGTQARRRGGFNQDAAQLVLLPPQVVGPLEGDGGLGGAGQGRQAGVQGLCDGQAHGQGQGAAAAGHLVQVERQAQGESQAVAGLGHPLAAMAAPASRLVVRGQQQRGGVASAASGQQLGVGGVGIKQNFQAQRGAIGLGVQPDLFGGGVQVDHGLAGQRLRVLGASMVPRHCGAPHQQAYSRFRAAVRRASITKP